MTLNERKFKYKLAYSDLDLTAHVKGVVMTVSSEGLWTDHDFSRTEWFQFVEFINGVSLPDQVEGNITTNPDKIQCQFDRHTQHQCTNIATNRTQMNADSDISYLCGKHHEFNRPYMPLFGLTESEHVVFCADGFTREEPS